MTRTSPPYRADHVGSLLRPPDLLQARDDFADGRIDAEALRAIEDEAIRDVVRRQQDAGLRTATDGEFRRASWHMDFIYQLDGVSKAPGNLTVKFHNEQGDIEFTPAALHIDGKLGVSKTIFGEDFAFLKQVAGDRSTPKLTIPSPSMVHYREAYIRHINESIAERPDGMTVTTHMCRGNFRSSWVAEGSYDFVAEALFNELGVDGFFMEWDDARSGGFEPLRFVPKGKVVVLGLVTTKRGELETKDLLKRRIEEASRYVDVDQLCLSPQCGFSSTVEGNVLSHEQQWAKLRTIVEVADEVWSG
jgi:5-methyltetrahydropteroyltriglutamate--homocysteine methyltransferase